MSVAVSPRSALCVVLTVVAGVLGGCVTDPDREWTENDGHRWRTVEPGGVFDRTGFERLDSSQTGVSFENTLTEASMARNRNYTNGAGVAAGDVNGDGWVDLYFGQMDGPNRLYLNEGTGALSFREATAEAGVAHEGVYTTGVTFADVDGDNDLDLLVASMSTDIVLYRNDGTGRFKRVENSGLGTGNGSTTLALADIDGDGDLDLYVTNYKEKSVKDLFEPSARTFQKTVRRSDDGEPYELRSPFDEHFEIFYPAPDSPDRRELGAEDELYLNDGDGTFSKASDLEERFQTHTGEPMGMAKDWGLTAKFQDLNDDGAPDLYVCNDFWTPDRVWMNQGDGTFQAIEPRAMRNFSFSSMAVDYADVNADGHLDVFVTEMLSSKRKRRGRQRVSFDPFTPSPGDLDYQPQYMRNSLYLGRPDDTFAEVSYFGGAAATEWSWATRFLDVDLDGYEDLLVNTGHAHDVLDLDAQEKIGRMVRNDAAMETPPLFQFPELPLANQALKNQGNGQFAEASAEWGFSAEDISHGLATADLDRDGDLDLAVSRLNEPAALYHNTATQPRIGVRLQGAAPNTRAIGAKLRLTGGPAPQRRQVEVGGDYLSDSEPMVVFAAEPGRDHELTITWPDGTTSSLDGVRANRIYEVQSPTRAGTDAGSETASTGAPNNPSDTTEAPIFRDVSDRLDHTHYEREFGDSDVQPLVPLKLSRLGPGVSWLSAADTSGGDLYVASGRGGALGVFENDGSGQFARRTGGRLTRDAPGDQTTVLGWSEADGSHLVVGSANFEQGKAMAASAFHYRIQEGDTSLVQRIPGIRSTTGPLAAADYTGDGRLDLFIGGRFKPARYPEDARSRLYTNDEGTFRLDEANADLLEKAGLVTGAVFVDYDGDGDSDLVLSRAWDALMLLENQDGTFRDVSEDVRLASDTGWWNGVATGDFNNDGRPDLVATNWGLNSRYQLEEERPLKLFYDDFDGDRTTEVVPAHYTSDRGGYVPYGTLYSYFEALPSFRRQVSSHADFATATVPELTGRSSDALTAKQITTLQHTLFLQTDQGFEARPLPAMSQYAPAFTAGVADYDNDGNEDLFLSQNLYAVPKLTPRQDAGRGLWLRGDGNGRFTPVEGSTSGVKVYGDQRGAALGDFNQDGRVDLAVAQNGAATKLYRNQTEERGVRVVLQGRRANEDAFGASLRIVYADGTKGPRRSVQAGSGHWSQNSAVQILGAAREPVGVEVTWTNGETTTGDLRPNQKEILVVHPDTHVESAHHSSY